MIRILCAVRSRETEGAFSTENFSECQVLGKSYGQYVVVTYTETGEPRSSSAEVYRDSN